MVLPDEETPVLPKFGEHRRQLSGKPCGLGVYGRGVK